MKLISTEQQLELVNRLRDYELFITDIECSAPVKTKGIMEGLANVRRAADFIESLARGAVAGSEYIGTVWAARDALEGDKQ